MWCNLFVFIQLLSPLGATPHKDQTWIAILDVQSSSSQELPFTTEQELARLSNRSRQTALHSIDTTDFALFTKDNMVEIMQDNGSELDCLDNSCAVSLGRTIGADWIVVGTLSKTDKPSLLLTYELYRSDSAALISLLEVEAETMDELLVQLEPAMMQLMSSITKTNGQHTEAQALSHITIHPTAPFTLGCDESQWKQWLTPIVPVFKPERIYCTDNSSPSSVVQVTHAFQITKHPITIHEWNSTLDHTNDQSLSSIPESRWSLDLSAHPAHGIQWQSAVQFANLRSQMDGYTPCYENTGTPEATRIKNCTGWRLPTEAEWELAMRGSLLHEPDWTGPIGYAWNIPVSKGGPVCEKLGNELGVCDITDNGWEWVMDWYGPYSKDSKIDPIGIPQGSHKVIRNGRHRGSYPPNLIPEDTKIGFRLVRSLN